jgi:hypothetical protein
MIKGTNSQSFTNWARVGKFWIRPRDKLAAEAATSCWRIFQSPFPQLIPHEIHFFILYGTSSPPPHDSTGKEEAFLEISRSSMKLNVFYVFSGIFKNSIIMAPNVRSLAEQVVSPPRIQPTYFFRLSLVVEFIPRTNLPSILPFTSAHYKFNDTSIKVFKMILP